MIEMLTPSARMGRFILFALAAICGAVTAAPAMADPITILFVGNSFTHGRYTPALNYNAGAGNAAGSATVHDVLCPTLPCTGAEGPTNPYYPTSTNLPPAAGTTVASQLAFLQANPSYQYAEVGPFSGVAGIFLQFTKEAGLNYDVSLAAVSSATLTGWANNTGNEAGDLSLIANSKYQKVVLQDQSFNPLPPTITVNGQTVSTRGSTTNSFQNGVSRLITAIDAADAAGGKTNAAITLAQTPPLASYGYTSDNPAQPIFGSSTPAQQGGNKAYAPYIGDANPIAAMASDLHNAYVGEATAYDAANPTKSHVDVALDGDAWVSAINLGIAEQNPFLVNEPVGQVDLWDSDPLLACCTVPVGYHPSAYGDYLNALVLFDQITGVDPTTLSAEVGGAPGSAATALGISGPIAGQLARAAAVTVQAGGPVPEPASLAVVAFGLVALGAARVSRRSR